MPGRIGRRGGSYGEEMSKGFFSRTSFSCIEISRGTSLTGEIMQLLIAYFELLGNIGCDLVQSYHLRPSSKRVWYCLD